MLIVHWTFLNGECFASYIFKKLKDCNYKVGQDSNKSEYMHYFPQFYYIIKFILVSTCIILTISFFIVSKRNNIPLQYVIPFIIICQLYIFVICFTKNHHENKKFHVFQEIVKYAYIIIFILVVLNKYKPIKNK